MVVMDLAIRYGQYAFLYGKIFRAAELVWTDGGKRGDLN
jgi:hypothetical protein